MHDIHSPKFAHRATFSTNLMKRSFSEMKQGALGLDDGANVSAEPGRGASPPLLCDKLAEFKLWRSKYLRSLKPLTCRRRTKLLQELSEHPLLVELDACRSPARFKKLLAKATAFLRLAFRCVSMAETQKRVVAIEALLDEQAFQSFLKKALGCGLSVAADGEIVVDVEHVAMSTILALHEYAEKALLTAKKACDQEKKRNKIEKNCIRRAEELVKLVRDAVAIGGDVARFRIMKAINRKSKKNSRGAKTTFSTLEDVNFVAVALHEQLRANVKSVCKKFEKKRKREVDLAERIDAVIYKRQRVELAANDGVFRCKAREGDECEYYYSVKTRDVVEKPLGFQSWTVLPTIKE